MTSEEEKTAKDKESKTPEVGVIDRMYQLYEKLNSAEDKQPLQEDYRQLLEAAHRSDKEKRLASQFITRFIEFFPNLYEEAINAMLDLCDEEDLVIRKQVIKDLYLVCKKVKPSKTTVPRIVDVLCQFILTADSAETQVLEKNIQGLFDTDAPGTLAGIFAQFHDGDEIVREAALRILVAKLKENSPEVAELPFQLSFYQELKQAAKFMNYEELKTLLDLLQSKKFSREVNGNRQITDLIYEKICLNEMLKADDLTAIRSLAQITDRAMGLLDAIVLPNPLINYYFTKVLPVFKNFGGGEKQATLQWDMMKRVAELLLRIPTIEEKDAKTYLDAAFDLALELLPPADSKTSVNYSLIECSLFFIYHVGAQLTSYIPSSERLDELTSRIVALRRPITSNKEKLRQAFKAHEIKPMDLTQLQNKKKIVALKVFKNLDILTRALIEDEIKYGQKLCLSWKPLTQPQPVFNKRALSAPALMNLPGKKGRLGKDRELQRYQPPGGKYSRGGAFGSYGGGHGGVGGGGGHGGGRTGFGKGGGFPKKRGSFRGNGRRF